MTWSSVKTTITPSHYTYIALTLSFLFPPELAEHITKLTKNCDEEQNLLDHRVMYMYSYMTNSSICNVLGTAPVTHRNACGLLSQVYPSLKTICTKKCLTSHIWRIGGKANYPGIATWPYRPITDNKSVSKRMIDSINSENYWRTTVRGETINSGCSLIGVGDISIKMTS